MRCSTNRVVVCCLVVASAGACGDDAGPGAARSACAQTAAASGPTCVGAPAPQWLLRDIQPASERFEEIYGPSELQGKPLLVVLLSSWCSFCRTQAAKLQQLQDELAGEGVDVTVVAINSIDGADNAELLTAAARFPVFQDTPEQRAWEAHEGQRDDFYVYDSEGKLAAFLPYGEGIELNLSKSGGYNNLRDRLRAVAQ